MMEDGTKCICPHCGQLMPLWIRIIQSTRLFKSSKQNDKELAELVMASRKLRKDYGEAICPHCQEASWFFINLAMEVRSPPLNEFGMEATKEKTKTKRKKVKPISNFR